MSDPYNQYPQSYGSPAPGGYGAPHQGYPQQQSPYPPQGGYQPNQQPWGQPHEQQGPQHYNQQAYDANQQVGGYGPPAQGGFYGAGQQPPAGYEQHGQPSYHDPNRGYQQDPSHQFPQQGAYNQSPYPADPNVPYGQQQHSNQYGATDPAQAGEGDRGLMGALAGGAAGAFGGKHVGGGHSILGGLAGAFLGSKMEDKFKDHRKHNQHGNNNGW